MLIHKLSPITDTFDLLHQFWENPQTQRMIALCLLWIYIFSLIGVELSRHNLFPSFLPQPPNSHFYAIHLSFTLILIVEVISLIFIIPSSLSKSMGKQFEILSLILLRNAFKELALLPEPVQLNQETLFDVMGIAVSGFGALAVFICLGIFKHLAKRHQLILNTEMKMRYVLSKKILALILFIIMGIIGGLSINDFLKTGKQTSFFENIYTLLIFSDIAIIFISQRFMPCYFAVFRNSGYVIGTLLMRLSLSAQILWSPILSIVAGIYVIALTWGINKFNPNLEKEKYIS